MYCPAAFHSFPIIIMASSSLNDIESLLALMFADDVSCFSDTVIRLQKMIDLIGQFCKSVGMEINLEKNKNYGLQEWWYR